VAIIKFDEPRELKLEFSTGKQVESKFKDRNGNTQYQYMWKCNDDDMIYASPSLNAMLMQETGGEKTGVKVIITKVDTGNTDDDGRTIKVFAVNGRTMEMRNKGIEADESPSFDEDRNVEITDEDIPF
jgi:hypothetical protein